MNWSAVLAYLIANKATVIFDAGLVLSALVKTLPIPGQPFHLYYWLYDASHAFFNVNNTRLNTQPTITPPNVVNEANPFTGGKIDVRTFIDRNLGASACSKAIESTLPFAKRQRLVGDLLGRWFNAGASDSTVYRRPSSAGLFALLHHDTSTGDEVNADPTHNPDLVLGGGSFWMGPGYGRNGGLGLSGLLILVLILYLLRVI